MKKTMRTSVRSRLAKLPQHVLADLLSSILEKGTFCDARSLVDLRREQKVHLEHCPLPDWAVQGVILSRDLLPKIVQHVQEDNCAAALACSSWNKAWQICSNQLPVQLPALFNEIGPKQGICAKINCYGETSIILRKGTKLYNFVDATSDRPTLDEIIEIKELDDDAGFYERALVASLFNFTYASTNSTVYKVCDGVKVKEVNALPDTEFGGTCVRIRQLLGIPMLKQVLVLVCDAITGNDHVRVFDEDLNYLYSFAEGENDCQGFAFISNRLYLCLTDCDTIERYSIGENGRFFQDQSHMETEGDWSQPLAITSATVNGKRFFYLVEQRNNDNRPEDEENKEDRGQCLIVMDESFNVLHRNKFLHNEEYFSGDLAVHNNCIFCTTEEEKGDGKVRNLHLICVNN